MRVILFLAQIALAILGALQSVAIPAQQTQQWVRVASGGNPGDADYREIYIDNSQIRVEGGLAHAWVRSVYTRTQKDNAGRSFSTQDAAEAFDCMRRTVGITSLIYIEASGRIVANLSSKPAEVTYYEARPGSINEGLLTYVCTHLPTNARTGKASQWIPYAAAASGQFFYTSDSLKFIGTAFEVAAVQNLTNPFRDKDSDKLVSNILLGIHGDCANSSIAYDYVGFTDDKLNAIGGNRLKEDQKRPVQPTKSDTIFLSLQFFCGTKGLTVTAAEEGPAEEDGGKAREKTGNKSGTAFAVSTNGFLLTNHHVINHCKTLTAFGFDGNTVPGRVVTSDERNDLALVKIDATGISAIPFRSQPIRAGDPIVALGFPYRGLLATEVNVSTGTVSALAGLANDTSKLQIQAPVQPGNSGGPLVDMSGSVAGVVVSKLDALYVAKAIGDLPQNVNFAVKGEIATLFLKSANVPIKFAQTGTARMDAADVASRVKPSVYLIECKND